MYNPFESTQNIEQTDEQLIEAALQGDKKCLELLITRHQGWVYNICLRMLGNPADAADLTQEILVKVITALSSFKKKSSFRTWLYRIVKNDVINREKKRKRENIFSFQEFGNRLDNAPDRELSPADNFGPDQKLLVEETKIRCMSGMLLCLDIKQRLIFILGELFDVSDVIGSEIMGISKVNFRVLLSRAKEQLYNFMNEKCGLENKSNPCRCARKTKAFIDAGIVDPQNLLFAKEHIRSIESIAGDKQYQMENLLEENYQRLYRQHPFLEPPDLSAHLREFLASERVAVTFNLRTNKNSSLASAPKSFCFLGNAGVFH